LSRIFLDDLRSAINTLFADNTIGSITAESLRNNCLDIVDSTTNDEALLTSSVPTPTLAVTTVWTDALVFDGQIGGDGNFLIPVFGTGTITGTATAGFTYQATGFLNANVPNNEILEVALGVNGVPLGFINTLQGLSGSEPLGAVLYGYNLSAGVSDVYSIMVRSTSGGFTLPVNDAEMTLTVMPTNNA
jgi:hypothetical protein